MFKKMFNKMEMFLDDLWLKFLMALDDEDEKYDHPFDDETRICLERVSDPENKEASNKTENQ